jgi:hypothetical protein
VVLAYLANRRHASPAQPDEACLGRVSRWIVALVGVAALATGISLFAVPSALIPLWPWMLTPLTGRVVGAIFCLGAAGIAVVADPRWITVRMMLEVEALMITFMLIAVIRSPGDFATDRPLTWVMLIGFFGVLFGSGILWFRHEVRPRT